ncbi:MAG: EAL domain-containing protein [Pseudomonadota bacterium]
MGDHGNAAVKRDGAAGEAPFGEAPFGAAEAEKATALAGQLETVFAAIDAPARSLRRAVSSLARDIADAGADVPEAASEKAATAARARQRLSGVLQVADEAAQRIDHVRIALESCANAEAPDGSGAAWSDDGERAAIRQVVARQLSGLAEDILDRRDENAAAAKDLTDALDALVEAWPDASVDASREALVAAEEVAIAPLGTLAEALREAASAVEPEASAPIAAAPPPWLEALYTMQEERVLHAAALTDMAGDAVADVDGAPETGQSAAPAEPIGQVLEARLASLYARLPTAESPAGFRLALAAISIGLIAISGVIAFGRGGTPTWVGLGIFLVAHTLAILGAASMLFRHGNLRTKRLAEDMERLAFRDALSGLLNRRGLTRLMSEQLSSTSEEIAALNVDLDHFKAVNDTLGHDAGDYVLAVSAERMSACISSDTLDLESLMAAAETAPGEVEGAAVCRTGGDEFCVVLWGEKAAQAEAIAAAIVEIAAQPIDYEGNRCQIGASIGIARGGGADGPRNPERVLSDADLATYVAKEEGRGRYAVFDASLREAQEAESRLALALFKALDPAGESAEGRIEVWFQPAVELPSGRVVAAEALARWRHPELGDVAPEEFLAAAERNGLAERISTEIMRLVTAAVADWQRAGVAVPLVTLNLGAGELRLRDLPDRLARAASAAGLEPWQLGVEASEMAATGRGSALAREGLGTLAGAGRPIFVDRFGRDEVSLSTVSAMSASAVKLDRGLVGQLGQDADGLALLKGLVALARSLDLPVMATGVETRAQLDLLREAGCDAFQGFAVARPEPAESFAAWLSFSEVVPAREGPFAREMAASRKAVAS